MHFRDFLVIYDNVASCHMSYSSTSMINYREELIMRQRVLQAVRDTQSRVTVIFHYPFDLAVVRYLCCLEIQHMHLALATTFFYESCSR